MYPPKVGKLYLYKKSRISMPPFLMESVGTWGMKSFPTKKHIKMKSSIIFSRL